jgi:hypothetical protein
MTEENKNTSLDLLGVKPIGEAANAVVNKSLGGIEGFLKTVCVPALEEFGLMLRDKVRHWRLNNITRILDKAQGKLGFENESLQMQAHPRVALAIIENGSLNDNEEVQEMWAGLFASSCTKTGQDDENLIFVDLLKQLTVCEARILKFSCESARKVLYENGLIVGDSLSIDCKTLIEVSGISEIHRLDRELDHLRSLELIGGGLGSGGFIASDINLIADITPTPLALNLYLKSQGHNTDPTFYWQANLITQADRNKEREEKEKEEMEKQKAEAEARRQETLAKQQSMQQQKSEESSN